MNYISEFIHTCPDTGLESSIEVLFNCEEEPAEYSEFWGFTVSHPPTGEIEIIEVLKDGKEWREAPTNEDLEIELSNHYWHRTENN